MLRGKSVCLRAQRRTDVEALHGPLYEDPESFMLTEGRAYRPESLESALAKYDKQLADAPEPRVAPFIVEAMVDLGSSVVAGQVLGDAALWAIDTHVRSAHIGITLLPAARGLGAGREVVDLLVDYAFRVRGLHRLQCETYSDNAAMLATAEAVGFRREGVRRDAGWRSGRHVDDVVLGLLATDRQPSAADRPPG